MFTKLLKYEYRATARVILPVFAIFLLLVGCTTLTSFVSEHLLPGALMEWLRDVLTTFSFLGFAAVLVVCTLLTVVRFYQMLGDGGYLYFSMPVTPAQHIMARAVVGTSWTTGFLLVCTLCLFFFNVTAEVDLSELFENPSAGWTIVGILLLCLVQCIAATMCSYFAMFLCCAIGAKWTQHRLLGTFAVYLAMGAISQVLGLILLVLAWIFDVPTIWLESLFDIPTGDGISLLQYFQISLPIWLAFFGTVIWGAVCFFITKKLLEKHLNLP